MMAIIPARGGSKGIPNKNLKVLGEYPLIVHTIRCAQESRYIDEIIVSTDSESIAQVSLEYGASIPFMRPAHLATDDSPAVLTYIYTIHKINETRNKMINDFVVLLPTVPFRKGYDVDAAIELYYAKEADSVISITESDIPIEWYLSKSEDGKIRHMSETEIFNRQNTNQQFLPNGAIYVSNICFLSSNKSFYSSNTYGYQMPKGRSIDIDDPYDLLLAQCLMNQKESKGI